MPANPSFTKRQKERARAERAQEKAQRRAQRKTEKEAAPREEREGSLVVSYNEEGEPQGFDFHDFQ